MSFTFRMVVQWKPLPTCTCITFNMLEVIEDKYFQSLVLVIAFTFTENDLLSQRLVVQEEQAFL